ncbi:hypothetical protein MDAP_002706 [Mitosporidium daphniae]|uniref:Protein kinase domain-containing protein n=1 Tax=Mitosporidium daphniae TaxID=1485682 RepID=A0A098VRG1_9MICR|nr:uncharacterized protein DI09_301p10 [Mitosporidium daphniae]KGG51622.1 hypothetical protein DI09_301p10 [Mitosporidium daphniae]|eukprot:XP_013238058.1 uncharacterized protein DI09_301p10 [Mitosporidium daphniae]
MIFSVHILALLFLTLYNISAATIEHDFSPKVPAKTTDQTEEVTLEYFIKGTFTEVSFAGRSTMHLASLVRDKKSLDQNQIYALKSIKMTKSEKEKLMSVITGDFLIKEIPENYKSAFIEREFSIQKNLIYQSIVRAYYKTDNMIFMEYVEGYDLLSKPQSWREKSKIFAYIFKKIAEGVKFMHDKGVVHGDLKPDNILVSKEGDVKIADFGGAVEIKRANEKGAGETEGTDLGEKPYSKEEYLFVFTKQYVAPELINSESVEPKVMKKILIQKKKVTQAWIGLTPHQLKFNFNPIFPTKKSDVFSFAATVVSFFVTKDGARYDRNYFAFKSNVQRLKNYKDILRSIKKIDPKLANIIDQALDPLPKNRPTIEGVLECLEKVPCCTKDEFKGFAKKNVKELELSPYVEKE